MGRPKGLLDKLTQGFFENVLDLRACICLVDPRKLNDPRYASNENFVDQIALADVLVANKTDVSDASALRSFRKLVADCNPAKAAVAQTVHGKLDPAWLTLPRNAGRNPVYPDVHQQNGQANVENKKIAQPVSWLRKENQGNGFQSCGWELPPEIIFDYKTFRNWVSESGVERAKGIFFTEKGWFLFNRSGREVNVIPTSFSKKNRIQMIATHADWDQLEKRLVACVRQ